MRFSHLIRRGGLIASLAAASSACSSEALESATDDLQQAVCQAPEDSLVAESIDDACGCAAAGATEVLHSSCARGVSTELLASLEQQMRRDCVARLSACHATVLDFRRCSEAANEELLETCSVDFPAGCEAFALAPGCASFVGCPLGFSRVSVDGAASCVADPERQSAAAGSAAQATALALLPQLRERADRAVRPAAR